LVSTEFWQKLEVVFKKKINIILENSKQNEFKPLRLVISIRFLPRVSPLAISIQAFQA
jgi:hypothetical protein